MAAGTIDLLIIIFFLAGVAVLGILSGGKKTTVREYFLGADTVPWWIVCFSIVAAETSTLTFISIPGLAYLANLNFLQVAAGYIIGRIAVSFFLLPHYYEGTLSTAYAFLERRFGNKTRTFASIVFLFTRTAADGVRLFATAIPLKLLLGIEYPAAIVIIAVVALIYTSIGGVKGVIYVDAVQMLFYLTGAAITAIFLVYLIPGDFGSILSTLWESGKLNTINLGFDNGVAGFFAQPYTLIGGLLGGAFLSMASHGTDQLVVQRLLATGKLKDGRKAIIGSGVVVFFQFVLFLFVGSLLFLHIGKTGMKADEIFPFFIISELPEGLRGFIIAGLFAAALSTLAGSISSLAQSTMMDLILRRNTTFSDKKQLFISRLVTAGWACMLAFSALFFMSTTQSVVEVALSIASFTYGGLLGTFLLGIVSKKAGQEDALAAFVAGITVMIIVIALKLTAWTWFTVIGVCVTLCIGLLLSFLTPRTEKENSRF